MSGNDIFVRKYDDGRLMQVLPDGSEVPLVYPESGTREMTDEEILEAAMSDPDCPPMTEQQLNRMKPAHPVRRLRFDLDLSRAEFAERYHLPLALVEEWESSMRKLDPATRALLHLIRKDPAGTAAALETFDIPRRIAAE